LKKIQSECQDYIQKISDFGGYYTMTLRGEKWPKLCYKYKIQHMGYHEIFFTNNLKKGLQKFGIKKRAATKLKCNSFIFKLASYNTHNESGAFVNCISSSF